MIEIKIASDTVTTALARLAQGLGNTAPLMTQLAGVLLFAVEENFAQGGRPAWAGLKPPVAKRRQGGQLLVDSGRLKNSLTVHADATSAVVGTNVKYAAIHQFGGQTAPHVIKPRYKKALAFNGLVVKQVNHPGSRIPARPFLALTDADEAKIVAKINDYLRNLVSS